MANPYNPGDSVWVDFDGGEFPGEVLKNEHGWVMAVIRTDPTWDYGAASARVAIDQTVCVQTRSLRERQRENPPQILDAPQSNSSG